MHRSKELAFHGATSSVNSSCVQAHLTRTMILHKQLKAQMQGACPEWEDVEENVGSSPFTSDLTRTVPRFFSMGCCAGHRKFYPRILHLT